MSADRSSVDPEDCPEPFWHQTHRYCPRCTWTEGHHEPAATQGVAVPSPANERLYAAAVHLDSLRIPYDFGGDTLRGLDCSKADSWIAREAGLLSNLMGTTELAHTAQLADGVGQFATLWVRTIAVAHSLWEFDMPGKGRQCWTARRTGTLVGFYRQDDTPRAWLLENDYHPRRRP